MFAMCTVLLYLDGIVRKSVFRVSDQVCHKPGCKPQKMAKDLKFQIQEEEGLFYLSRESKGADQLRCYQPADLSLCFCIC